MTGYHIHCVCPSRCNADLVQMTCEHGCIWPRASWGILARWRCILARRRRFLPLVLVPALPLSGCASDLCALAGIFGGESQRAECSTPTLTYSLSLDTRVDSVMPYEKLYPPPPDGTAKRTLWEMNRAVGLPPP